MSKTYFYSLQRYNKILAQRNNLLKDKDEETIRETLPVWDAELVKEASEIIKQRNDFLKKLAPVAEEKHAFLSGGKENLFLKAESGYYGEKEEIAYALKEDLKSVLYKDMRLGFSTIGPHRDDVKFLLNGEDVKIYGSQGQQRTVALVIKLAETELFKQRFGEYPILILDDVLSELDRERQKRLISSVGHMQTIFTSTSVDGHLFKNTGCKKMSVKNGRIN